jgi:dienelactone hydrolase
MQVVRMALRVIGRVLSLVAIAGITFLSNRKKVDPARAGLVGSSQAGWVAAQAIRHAARPADVFLLECRRDSNDGCRAKFVQY